MSAGAAIGDNGHEIGKLLKPLIGGSGFTGNAPGGLSRWSRARAQTHSVGAETGRRGERRSHSRTADSAMAHRLIRWRDDKEPTACTMDQIIQL